MDCQKLCYDPKENRDSDITFLSQIGLSFLDCANDHIADTSRRQSVEASAEALNGNHVQVLSARVVGTVDDGADGQAERDAELATANTSSTQSKRTQVTSCSFSYRLNRIDELTSFGCHCQ